jgi:hypothetical protein
MTILRRALAATAFAASFAQAETPTVHASPAPLNIAAVLNIDSARAQVVQAILESAHQRRMAAMEKIRADTDQQLASVLNADELARLKEALPPPPRPGDGARRRGTAM